MREIEFYYLEILNTTEQLMVFRTTYNKEKYGIMLTLNTALPLKRQDEEINRVIEQLSNMKTKDAKKALIAKEID